MRDVRGKPVAPDKDAKVKGDTEDAEGKHMDPLSHLAGCEDCMKAVTAHMGSSGKADAFKTQDQSGKAKIGAGETYVRRRH